MHHVIYIPGLNDQNFPNKQLSKIILLFWKRLQVEFHIFEPRWNSKESFTKKLSRILSAIDELASNGNKVSLIGESAGGSAGFNAFSQRKTKFIK